MVSRTPSGRSVSHYACTARRHIDSNRDRSLAQFLRSRPPTLIWMVGPSLLCQFGVPNSSSPPSPCFCSVRSGKEHVIVFSLGWCIQITKLITKPSAPLLGSQRPHCNSILAKVVNIFTGVFRLPGMSCNHFFSDLKVMLTGLKSNFHLRAKCAVNFHNWREHLSSMAGKMSKNAADHHSRIRARSRRKIFGHPFD